MRVGKFFAQGTERRRDHDDVANPIGQKECEVHCVFREVFFGKVRLAGSLPDHRFAPQTHEGGEDARLNVPGPGAIPGVNAGPLAAKYSGVARSIQTAESLNSTAKIKVFLYLAV